MADKSTATSVASFSFDNFSVRAINKDSEIWFVAADVGSVLGLGNVRSSLALLDDDESAVHSMDIRSENGIVQKREVNIINESGLYALILRSRKPEAKRFRKWVTSEVLPSIRKTGSYSVSINKAQQGELTTLIRERFPSGKDRPYAWSRFNNHFRLSSYKNLPANRFDEACEYIKTMQDDRKKNPLPPPAQTSHLSPDQVRELKSLYHQLIMLFHPYSQYAYAMRGIMRILRGFQAQHELEVRPEGYVDVIGDDND